MSLEKLSQLIEGLEIGVNSRDLQRAIEILDLLDARLAVAVAEFEAAAADEREGAAVNPKTGGDQFC